MGPVVIYTGHGKGKTTSALGAALDVWARGGSVLVLQFIKGGWRYGELAAAAALGSRFTVRQAGLGFVRFAGPEEKAAHRESARRALAEAERSLGQYDLVVLDEVIYAVGFGLLTVEEVVSLVRARPPAVTLVLTGRNAPFALVELADAVFEAVEVRHHAGAGVGAQKGIEY
ncbi:MAG: cob(I)yrinic acid a,c-diamide adenosyltransferase [Peptococcaceae bacterium]|jgi:cob(I)alamin adenosyltransferase|nr:cob(I)yrinic acid a,c-diamide adenosyltransferase [Peptococcaceae bacterium]